MGMWIGRNRKARVTYGFDEIALVPGEVTINPNEVDTSFKIPRKDGSAIELKIPIIASAMDGVTDVQFCIAMGKLGGLGVINLEGVQTRYANPDEVLEKIVKAGKEDVTTLIQKFYTEPIKEELIAKRDHGTEKRRGAGRRQFHSAKGRALRLHRPGGRRRSLRRAIHRLHRQTYFHRIQIPRTGGLLQKDAHPRHHRQRRHLQRHPAIDGLRRGRRADRRRTGRGLHQPRRPGPGRAASHRHRRLRRRARLSSQDKPAATSPSSPTAA